MSQSVIEKFRKFLSREERERILKREKLHKILKKMRKKQKELEEELAECHDVETASKLRKKIRILQEQRRKGTEMLAELRRLARQAEGGSHQSR
ncbi:hypothetical protein [Wenzhouxiangella limi]|uniref:Uncharacterized protein n=1 Tax=Wenzhouxiangella limi TaxID=2707351 RepID=A0A845V4I1_9GAMM|nr:hypothetical protein [Wenzhouxiangella limi]NDY95141.1 hypothetical protein [Wenzhouxiangella limi]